jgi:hypothetical protein
MVKDRVCVCAIMPLKGGSEEEERTGPAVLVYIKSVTPRPVVPTLSRQSMHVAVTHLATSSSSSAIPRVASQRVDGQSGHML